MVKGQGFDQGIEWSCWFGTTRVAAHIVDSTGIMRQTPRHAVGVVPAGVSPIDSPPEKLPLLFEFITLLKKVFFLSAVSGGTFGCANNTRIAFVEGDETRSRAMGAIVRCLNALV